MTWIRQQEKGRDIVYVNESRDYRVEVASAVPYENQFHPVLD